MVQNWMPVKPELDAKTMVDPGTYALITHFLTGREAVEALPDQIRVGPFDFSLQKWNSMQAQGQHCYGQCSPCEMRISIQLDMPSPQKAADTFLHETNHAIWWVYCLGDDAKEEQVVTVLSRAWLQVYRGNPFVLPWLQRCC